MNRVSDYVECTECARRSTQLLVNLDDGRCENCWPLTAAGAPAGAVSPLITAANRLNARSGFGPMVRVR